MPYPTPMLSTSSYIKGAGTAFVLFILGDALWHDMLMGSFYMSRIDAINGGPAPATFPCFIILFELIAALGSTYLVLHLSKNIAEAAKNGAILGLMMVSAINLVNHTIILRWDLTLVVVDTAWGVVLGFLVGAATYYAAGMKRA